MNKVKNDSVLTFFNIFSSDLMLEECKSLLDVSYLLHIIITYIKTGELKYATHENFGYQNVVDFLIERGMSSRICSSLRPELARQGNEYEISKFLLSLFFELRLSRPEELIGFISKLSPKEHKELAHMVSELDRVDISTINMDDFWASILIMSPEERLSSAPSASTSSDTDSAPIIASRNSISLLSSSINSSFLNQSRQLLPSNENDPLLSKKNIPTIANSPIAAVLNSPMGSALSNLRKQRNIINTQKERIEQMEHELDEYTAYCDKLKELVERLESSTKRQEHKISALRKELENIPFLEDRVKQLENAKFEAKIETNNLRGKLDTEKAYRSRLIFERDNSLQELERAQLEITSLTQSLEALRRTFKDEVDMHNMTREKLSSVEYQRNAIELNLKGQIQFLQQKLLDTEQIQNCQFKEKEVEIHDNLIPYLNPIQEQDQPTPNANEIGTDLSISEEKNLRSIAYTMIRVLKKCRITRPEQVEATNEEDAQLELVQSKNTNNKLKFILLHILVVIGIISVFSLLILIVIFFNEII